MSASELSPGKFRGIVFDIDGTAVPDSALHVESERLLAAFARLPRDFMAIAATGRTVDFARPIITQLGLRHRSIVANGAQIMEPSGEVKNLHVLSREQVLGVLSACHALEYQVCLDGDPMDRVVTARQQEVRETAGAFLLDVPKDVAEEVYEQVTGIPDVNVYISSSWAQGRETFDVNVGHANARKDVALGELLGEYGIDPSDMIGMGDGVNDLPLFDAVGCGIAVANAHPDLLARADVVAPSQEQDGLAAVLERFAVAGVGETERIPSQVAARAVLRFA